MVCIKGIDPAKFRERITIQNNNRASDGQGGYTDSWTTGTTVWAQVKQLRMGEKYIQMQMKAPADYEFTIRYNTALGLDNDSRIVYDGDNYNIVGIDNVDEADFFYKIRAVRDAPT